MTGQEPLSLDDLEYELPAELIAQEPAPSRSDSRLMVVDVGTGEIRDSSFSRLPEYLEAGDLLALNDTGVIRARLRGRRAETGGSADLLLVERSREAPDTWVCMVRPAKRARSGIVLEFQSGLRAEVVEDLGRGRALIRFLSSGQPVEELIHSTGEVPLPPYVRREPTAVDEERYQTVYASTPGAIAAPTAGLHFTRSMLDGLAGSGVETVFLTLHVGPGTFTPLRERLLHLNRLESERFSVSAEAWREIARARDAGRRIVSVGTTTCRVLETLSFQEGELQSGNASLAGRTDLFIYPPYRFRNVGALLTNFHLPGTSLLALVAAFMGLDLMLSSYAHAVDEGYRFYSYGDAMLLLGCRRRTWDGA